MIRTIVPLQLVLAITLTGCFGMATTDTHIKKDALKIIPKYMLIGTFQHRNLSYDPFVLKNFRDLLAYEFFKQGYTTAQIDMTLTGRATEAENTRFTALSLKYTPFVFIEGIISENNYGDSIDTEISTSILLKLYNSKGVKIGETIYLMDESLADAKLMKKVAASMADTLHSNLAGHN